MPLAGRVRVPDERWPAATPAGAVRFARGTRNLQACRSFYGDLLRLPLLFEFDSDNEDGICGVIFGVPDTGLTLELIQADASVHVDPHDQLVLYLPGGESLDLVARRLLEAGVPTLRQYTYWEQRGARTFSDPDGRALVLAPWIFGVDPVPAPTVAGGRSAPGGVEAHALTHRNEAHSP
jgi:catechol 2,3-dioxygenase-like lactoylglutathione lyase family enzyme